MKGFVKGFLVTLGVLAAIAFVGVMNNTWTWATIITFCTSEVGKIILFCVGIFLLVAILMKISKPKDSTKEEKTEEKVEEKVISTDFDAIRKIAENLSTEEKAELIKILLK